jgi:hypothetical protein
MHLGTVRSKRQHLIVRVGAHVQVIDTPKALQQFAYGHGGIGSLVLHVERDERLRKSHEQRLDRRNGDALTAERMPAVEFEVPTGVERREFGRCERRNVTRSVGGSIEGGVVNGDGHTVGRDPHIDVDDLAAHGDAVLERVHRVFGKHAIAARMGNDERSPDAERIHAPAIVEDRRDHRRLR